MSKLIENSYYNLIVNRYIHLNPVKDKLTLKPGNYRWSSYRIYLGEEKSGLVDEREILGYFGGERSLYNKFIMKFVYNKTK